MRSLLIKTILVISAVALTGALAWSDENSSVDPADVNLQGLNRPKADTEGRRCPECEKRAAQAALLAKTNAQPSGVSQQQKAERPDGEK